VWFGCAADVATSRSSNIARPFTSRANAGSHRNRSYNHGRHRSCLNL
jgi:hypothetical protein